jgi:predicted phage tail protein
LTISTARTEHEPIGETFTLAVVIVPAPATVRQAGVVVALEGAALVVVAVVLVVRAIAGAHEKAISGYGTAAWYTVMGAGVIAAGWALWTGSFSCCRWRGTSPSARNDGPMASHSR